MTTPRDRFYPSACQSATCGRTECSGCPHAAALFEFHQWRKRTRAYQPDHIWSPTLWRQGPPPPGHREDPQKPR